MSFLDKFIKNFDKQQEEKKDVSASKRQEQRDANIEDQAVDQLQDLMFSSSSIASKENQQPINLKQREGIKFKSINGTCTSSQSTANISSSAGVSITQELIKKKSLAIAKNTTFFHDYTYDPHEFPPLLSGKLKNPLSLYRSSRVTLEQSKEVKSILFNDQKGKFSKGWRQGFYFTQTRTDQFCFEQSKYKTIPFLHQREDEPSGLLSVVQAHLLKHLLFVSKFDCMSLEDLNEDKYTIALMAALTDILVKVSKSQASKQEEDILTLERNDSEDANKNPKKKQVYGFYLVFPDLAPQANPIQPIQCLLYEVPRHSWQELFQLLCSMRTQYMQAGGHGVLLFLYSILFTHKISTIRQQMTQKRTLIDQNGFASLQLINLLNLGKASSPMNEADKKQATAVSKRNNIGFLTYKESLKRSIVENNLKTPILSIWVIQIQNGEYGVLFIDDLNSMNKRYSKIQMLFYEGRGRLTNDQANDKVVIDIEIQNKEFDCTHQQLFSRIQLLQSIVKTRWGISAKVKCLNQFI